MVISHSNNRKLIHAYIGKYIQIFSLKAQSFLSVADYGPKTLPYHILSVIKDTERFKKRIL